MRPPPQAARPLERAAWLLAHRSDLWEQLPADMHDLLCDQPVPLGAFFGWLDRLVADQGPVNATELLAQLRIQAQGPAPDDTTPDAPWNGPPADEALSALAQRLANFHDVANGQETAEELIALIRPLQLQALNDELELLLQSGELSDTAEARKVDLIRQANALKLEISRLRPISG